MEMNVIYNKDCISGMMNLPQNSIDICVTSPPYNLNIDYGVYNDNKAREEYLNWIDELCIAIKHCLKDNGHFWLNVGYSNIDPWVGMDVANVVRKHFVLQNNFTWVKSISIDNITKGHFKPINSERFSNPTWEHLFHFTKNGNVKCDKLSVGVPYMYDCNIDNSSRIKGRIVKKMGFENQVDFQKRANSEEVDLFEKEFQKRILKQKVKPSSRCRGNSWFIPYDTISNRDKHRGSHPATYPVQLVEDCIKFSGIKNGILVDPFMGSGTSAIASINQDINFIGYDIDSNYIEFANDRINDHKKTRV